MCCNITQYALYILERFVLIGWMGDRRSPFYSFALFIILYLIRYFSICSILHHVFMHMHGEVVIHQKFYELRALHPLLLPLHTSFAICGISGALETLMLANLPF